MARQLMQTSNQRDFKLQIFTDKWPIFTSKLEKKNRAESSENNTRQVLLVGKSFHSDDSTTYEPKPRRSTRIYRLGRLRPRLRRALIGCGLVLNHWRCVTSWTRAGGSAFLGRQETAPTELTLARTRLSFISNCLINFDFNHLVFD